MRRITGATLVVAACSVGLAVGAQASNGDKVSLCHGTASESNPYVLIRVSENALEGHFDGTAPGHGQNNHEDYVLPEGATECTGLPDGGGEGGE